MVVDTFIGDISTGERIGDTWSIDTSTFKLEDCRIEIVEELRLPLVNRFYADCKYRVKCGRHDRVYSVTYQNNIVAAARLIPQASGHFLLRNLRVSIFMRQKGIAKHLIKHIVTHLPSANCYCHSLLHLQDFYLSLNFQHLEPEQVPPEIGEVYKRDKSRGRSWVLMGYIAQSY